MGSDVLLPMTRHRGDVSKMKVRLAALCGFLFGFAMAFVTLLTYGNSVSEVLSERPTTLVITTADGSTFGSSAIAKSEPDLYQEVRVVCMVLTYSDNRNKAEHLNATWGKRCNRLIFLSNENDKDLGAVDIGVENSHDNLWAKTRETLRYVYENHFDEGDWFIKADDDTYVVMENLRYMLYAYDPETPIYFGHKFTYETNIENFSFYQIYMSGGGGYVLSKEALRRFMVDAYDNETLCYGAYPQAEDVQIGLCLGNVGVDPGNSTDPMDSKQRFYPLKLSDYLQPNAETILPEWLFNRSYEPVQLGPSCCSEYAITFHYIEPSDMYLYDFLLYHMRAHGVNKPFRALPEKVSTELG